MNSSVQSGPQVVVLIVILFIGAYFRFHHLWVTPPGLYPDEAINGIDAVAAIESGHFAVFYPANGGREGLFINLQAFSTYVFGHNALALRIVSAGIGTATVLGVYLLAKRVYQNWHIAAIAACLIAVGFWHVNFSRIGFRAIMAPFFFVWGFYLLENAIRSLRSSKFGLSGATFGLGLYSYISYRIMPLVICTVLLFHWRAISFIHSPDRAAIKRKFRSGLLFFSATFTLTIIPIALYFINNGHDFIQRTVDACICNNENPFQEFVKNVFRTLGMFMFVGDSNWRHNISGNALLVWPVAISFAVGGARALWAFWQLMESGGKVYYTRSFPHAAMLSWFLVGLIPAILSDEAPHALRTLVVAPSVYMLAGEGLYWISGMLQRALCAGPAILAYQFLKRPIQNGSVRAIFVILLLGSIGIGEYQRYFFEWASSPKVAEAFAQSYVDVAAIINRLPRIQKKCVLVNFDGDQIDFWSPATIMFLTDTEEPEQQKAKNVFYVRPDGGTEHDCSYTFSLQRLTE